LAAAEVEPDRKDVTEDRAERDRVEHEVARDRGIEADAGDRPPRKPRRGDDPLRDIDHDDPQREPLALRAEGVRAAGIPAAEPADIDAALQIADDEAAKDRAQQVRDREFQSELEHALRILRRTGQPSLPARSCLLVRVLAELQPASIAR